MLVLDAAATREALPFERLIPALRTMFAAGCTVPARHVHEIPTPAGEHFTSLIMPAWLEGRYYGVKTINIAPGNAARGLPGLHASYVLYDGVSGVPLATEPLIHGGWLKPGSHLDLIGSFTPAMREADDACFVDAARYVDTEEALQKSGELLGPLSRGILRPADLRGSLGTLSRGEATGRLSFDQRTYSSRSAPRWKTWRQQSPSGKLLVRRRRSGCSRASHRLPNPRCITAACGRGTLVAQRCASRYRMGDACRRDAVADTQPSAAEDARITLPFAGDLARPQPAMVDVGGRAGAPMLTIFPSRHT